MNKQELLEQYQHYKDLKLDINMARGKPCPEQLNLSLPMLDIVNSKTNCFDEDIDCRNYSALEGIPECKKLFSDIIDMPVENIIVCGASSLNIMHNLMVKSIVQGVNGELPFSKQGKIKWLCPVPGYDRHFAMTESFGFELINIPMDENGEFYWAKYSSVILSLGQQFKAQKFWTSASQSTCHKRMIFGNGGTFPYNRSYGSKALCR